jgi:hypothetical protein
MSTSISMSGRVPSPVSLLLIQAGGGVLALLPIVSLRRFATLTNSLYWMLVAGASFNVVLSLILLTGQACKIAFYQRTIGRLGERGLCRLLIIYDTILLGTLVFSTGGAENSAFSPQFAAILPVAMLIPDFPHVKWAYAGLFLIMFLVGLTPLSDFTGYLPGRPEKQIWFLVFFFIFTLFPVAYSIQAERDSGGSGISGKIG